MELGNFCMCLAVKDLQASKSFYEKFGFAVVSGNADENWLVLKSGHTKIGIFQGMFEQNMLCFNPGWDENGQALPDFTDVREIQKHLKAQEVTLVMEADETTTGPAYFMLKDPDGNDILVNQHV